MTIKLFLISFIPDCIGYQIGLLTVELQKLRKWRKDKVVTDAQNLTQ